VYALRELYSQTRWSSHGKKGKLANDHVTVPPFVTCSRPVEEPKGPTNSAIVISISQALVGGESLEQCRNVRNPVY